MPKIITEKRFCVQCLKGDDFVKIVAKGLCSRCYNFNYKKTHVKYVPKPKVAKNYDGQLCRLCNLTFGQGIKHYSKGACDSCYKRESAQIRRAKRQRGEQITRTHCKGCLMPFNSKRKSGEYCINCYNHKDRDPNLNLSADLIRFELEAIRKLLRRYKCKMNTSIDPLITIDLWLTYILRAHINEKLSPQRQVEIMLSDLEDYYNKKIVEYI